jgi:hypothetical protein
MIGWIKRNSDNRLVHTNSGADPNNQGHVDALLATARSTMSDVEFTYGFDEDSVVRGWLQAQIVAESNTWERQMERSDPLLPRWGEDLYDAFPQAQRDGAAQELQDLVAAKKALRDARP